MIKPFLNKDFLLDNDVAGTLYHDYAKSQPLIDYHNHLPPQQFADNINFENITKVWLDGDHYKWRAMRAFGIDESYITGSRPDNEKFSKWAETVPFTIRNPLYHWTHLELQRYFGIDSLLSPTSSEAIYERTSAQLQEATHTTQGLLKQMNVKVICSTDDPIDDLRYHQQAFDADTEIKMYPAFRPDKAIFIEQENFAEYIHKLEDASGVSISGFDDLIHALHNRAQFFAAMGCRISDHGLEHIYASDFTAKNVDTALKARLAGADVTPEAALEYKSAVLYHLGVMYAELGWVQQFHLGALRNTNSRLLGKLGPDTGFDSIGDWLQASSLAKYLNRLDSEDKLAKTILYNLNPRDNEVFATMIGNYQDGTVKGKMQLGSGWWFLDQKDGMEKQINALSNMGLLSCFVGMLTDSRSFLSFPRHEYFRRILCNMIGKEVTAGQLPNDMNLLGGIVQDICYRNAKNYFNF